MKSFQIDEEKYLTDQAIMTAILDAATRKNRNRRDVQKVLRNLDYYVPEIRRVILEEDYHPRKHSPVVIHSERKDRSIIKPDFYPEQIVHHILVTAFKEALMSGMIDQSMGSIPNRGCHAGMRYIRKWLTNDPKGTRYCFQGDIHHFFQSVDKELLKEDIQRKIRPCHMRNLWCQIIDEGAEQGIPLGFYTSQWNGNFFLTPMDHYIQSLDGVSHYIRYMDDIIVFGPNKKKLHRVKDCIEKYLFSRKLQLKTSWQIFPIEYEWGGKKHGRPLDFMGYKFYRNRVTLRKDLAYASANRAKTVSRTKWNIRIASGAISYKGWIDDSDTYAFFQKHIKPYTNYHDLRRFISRRQKQNTNALLIQCARQAVKEGFGPCDVQEFFKGGKMIENCILLEKTDIQKIVAEHYGVPTGDVIMHNSTITVKLPKENATAKGD